MNVHEKELQVEYAQVAVFNADMADPFNDWSERHVRQGFSLRNGSVSFKTLDEVGAIRARAWVGDDEDLREDAVRIIRVPFVVEAGAIEIATISDSLSIEIPRGSYTLTFSQGYAADGRMYGEFVWQRMGEVIQPNILRADAELSPEFPLLVDANAATP